MANLQRPKETLQEIDTTVLNQISGEQVRNTSTSLAETTNGINSAKTGVEPRYKTRYKNIENITQKKEGTDYLFVAKNLLVFFFNKLICLALFSICFFLFLYHSGDLPFMVRQSVHDIFKTGAYELRVAHCTIHLHPSEDTASHLIIKQNVDIMSFLMKDRLVTYQNDEQSLYTSIQQSSADNCKADFYFSKDDYDDKALVINCYQRCLIYSDSPEKTYVPFLYMYGHVGVFELRNVALKFLELSNVITRYYAEYLDPGSSVLVNGSRVNYTVKEHGSGPVRYMAVATELQNKTNYPVKQESLVAHEDLLSKGGGRMSQKTAEVYSSWYPRVYHIQRQDIAIRKDLCIRSEASQQCSGLNNVIFGYNVVLDHYRSETLSERELELMLEDIKFTELFNDNFAEFKNYENNFDGDDRIFVFRTLDDLTPGNVYKTFVYMNKPPSVFFAERYLTAWGYNRSSFNLRSVYMHFDTNYDFVSRSQLRAHHQARLYKKVYDILLENIKGTSFSKLKDYYLYIIKAEELQPHMAPETQFYDERVRLLQFFYYIAKIIALLIAGAVFYLFFRMNKHLTRKLREGKLARTDLIRTMIDDKFMIKGLGELAALYKNRSAEAAQYYDLLGIPVLHQVLNDLIAKNINRVYSSSFERFLGLVCFERKQGSKHPNSEHILSRVEFRDFVYRYKLYCLCHNLKYVDVNGEEIPQMLDQKGLALSESLSDFDYLIINVKIVNFDYSHIFRDKISLSKTNNFNSLSYFINNHCQHMPLIDNCVSYEDFVRFYEYFCDLISSDVKPVSVDTLREGYGLFFERRSRLYVEPIPADREGTSMYFDFTHVHKMLENYLKLRRESINDSITTRVLFLRSNVMISILYQLVFAVCGWTLSKFIAARKYELSNYLDIDTILHDINAINPSYLSLLNTDYNHLVMIVYARLITYAAAVVLWDVAFLSGVFLFLRDTNTLKHIRKVLVTALNVLIYLTLLVVLYDYLDDLVLVVLNMLFMVAHGLSYYIFYIANYCFIVLFCVVVYLSCNRILNDKKQLLKLIAENLAPRFIDRLKVNLVNRQRIMRKNTELVNSKVVVPLIKDIKIHEREIEDIFRGYPEISRAISEHFYAYFYKKPFPADYETFIRHYLRFKRCDHPELIRLIAELVKLQVSGTDEGITARKSTLDQLLYTFICGHYARVNKLKALDPSKISKMMYFLSNIFYANLDNEYGKMFDNLNGLYAYVFSGRDLEFIYKTAYLHRFIIYRKYYRPSNEHLKVIFTSLLSLFFKEDYCREAQGVVVALLSENTKLKLLNQPLAMQRIAEDTAKGCKSLRILQRSSLYGQHKQTIEKEQKKHFDVVTAAFERNELFKSSKVTTQLLAATIGVLEETIVLLDNLYSFFLVEGTSVKVKDHFRSKYQEILRNYLDLDERDLENLVYFVKNDKRFSRLQLANYILRKVDCANALEIFDLYVVYSFDNHQDARNIFQKYGIPHFDLYEAVFKAEHYSLLALYKKFATTTTGLKQLKVIYRFMRLNNIDVRSFKDLGLLVEHKLLKKNDKLYRFLRAFIAFRDMRQQDTESLRAVFYYLNKYFSFGIPEEDIPRICCFIGGMNSVTQALKGRTTISNRATALSGVLNEFNISHRNLFNFYKIILAEGFDANEELKGEFLSSASMGIKIDKFNHVLNFIRYKHKLILDQCDISDRNERAKSVLIMKLVNREMELGHGSRSLLLEYLINTLREADSSMMFENKINSEIRKCLLELPQYALSQDGATERAFNLPDLFVSLKNLLELLMNANKKEEAGFFYHFYMLVIEFKRDILSMSSFYEGIVAGYIYMHDFIFELIESMKGKDILRKQTIKKLKAFTGLYNERYKSNISFILKYKMLKNLSMLLEEKNLEHRYMDFYLADTKILYLLNLLVELRNNIDYGTKDLSSAHEDDIYETRAYYLSKYKIDLQEVVVLYNLCCKKISFNFAEVFFEDEKNSPAFRVVKTFLLAENVLEYENTLLTKTNLVNNSYLFQRLKICPYLSWLVILLKKGDVGLAKRFIRVDLYDKIENGDLLLNIVLELVELKNLDVKAKRGSDMKFFERVDDAGNFVLLKKYFKIDSVLYTLLNYTRQVSERTGLMVYDLLRNKNIDFLSFMVYLNTKHMNVFKIDFIFDYCYIRSIVARLTSLKERVGSTSDGNIPVDSQHFDALEKINKHLRFYERKSKEMERVFEELVTMGKFFSDARFVLSKLTSLETFVLRMYLKELNQENLEGPLADHADLINDLVVKELLSRWVEKLNDESMKESIGNFINSHSFTHPIAHYIYQDEDKYVIHWENPLKDLYYTKQFLKFFRMEYMADIAKLQDISINSGSVHQKEEFKREFANFNYGFFVNLISYKLRQIDFGDLEEVKNNYTFILTSTDMLFHMLQKISVFSTKFYLTRYYFFITLYLMSFGIILKPINMISFSADAFDPFNLSYLLHQVRKVIPETTVAKLFGNLKAMREYKLKLIQVKFLAKIMKFEASHPSSNSVFKPYYAGSQLEDNSDSINLLAEQGSILASLHLFKFKVANSVDTINNFYFNTEIVDMKAETRASLYLKLNIKIYDPTHVKLTILNTGLVDNKYYDSAESSEFLMFYYGRTSREAKCLDKCKDHFKNYYILSYKAKFFQIRLRDVFDYDDNAIRYTGIYECYSHLNLYYMIQKLRDASAEESDYLHVFKSIRANCRSDHFALKCVFEYLFSVEYKGSLTRFLRLLRILQPQREFPEGHTHGGAPEELRDLRQAVS